MSLWLTYLLISTIAGGVLALIHRFVIKKFDYASYGFLTQGIAAILLFPIFLFSFKIPTQTSAWYILPLSMFLWGITTVVTFKSYKHIDVSIRATFSNSKFFYVAILSFFVLSEAFPPSKILGTILIFAGILAINLRKRIFSFRDIGVILTLISSFISAIAVIVDKFALSLFPPMMYIIFTYLGPTISLGMVTSTRIEKLKTIIRKRFGWILLSASIDVVYYLSLLNALSIQEASVVFPISQLASLIAVFGGIVILKERQNISEKLLGAAIAIVGALFVSGYLAI